MPGKSLASASDSFFRPGLLACLLAAALAVGGAACKQDEGERCETDDDCADPELNRCSPFNRTTESGGVCERRLAGMDAGTAPDAGAEAGAGVEAGDAAGEAGEAVDGGADTAGDSAMSADGASEVSSETSSSDAPAADVVPDLAAAELASEAG